MALGWTIETQLASIMPYLIGVWVNRGGVWLGYDPVAPTASDLQEILPGEEVEINVSQACLLSDGVNSWSLIFGWNTITWPAAVVPPPTDGFNMSSMMNMIMMIAMLSMVMGMVPSS